MIKDKIIVFVPHKIVSEANNFENRWRKNDRKKALQWAVKAALSQHVGEFPLPCTITFERIGKKLLDDDNLAFAFKAARDMTAKIIIERTEKAQDKPIGCYDGDPRLEWKYEQRSQKKSVFGDSPLGFYITIEKQEPIKLSDKDRDMFLETLRNPPKPNEKLKQAWEQYDKCKNLSQITEK